MNTLTITTYQASGIGREEPTDFPIKTETFQTYLTSLTAAINHYLISEFIVAEDEIEDYMDQLDLGADGSYYKEEDQTLIGYSFN